MSNNDNSGDWCTIESDPGVFTEMLEDLGCKHIEFEELYSLDDESLSALTSSGGIVYGLIFLFKWLKPEQQQAAASTTSSSSQDKDPPKDLFFAHQVTTNACATQAILSVILNSGLSNDEKGKILSEFYGFTESFDPTLKGEAISSSEDIRTVHNSFARSHDNFLQDKNNANQFLNPFRETEDVYHFIAYVPYKKNSVVYELDGLQSHPINLGTYDATNNDNSWIFVARDAIQKRMSMGGNLNEIKFNLMAVIQDQRVLLEKQKQFALETNDTETLNQLTMELSNQEMKRKQWKLENQRRRHNYLPLCIEIIKALAETNQLEQLSIEAKQRVFNKRNTKK